jgi:tetratricopeptide (TPR) repeat protein
MPSAVDSPAPVRPLLRLAGTPHWRLDGRDLATGTRKALALAVLAVLEPTLRRSRAADLLWPDTDPAAARRNLRRDLFRLRRSGLPIVDGPGEALMLTAVDLDWPAPSSAPPAWLDGIDEVAGAELAHWVTLQRQQLQRRWIEHLVDGARALEAAGPPAQALQAWRAVLADGAAGPGHAQARQALLRLHEDSESPLPAALPATEAPAARTWPVRMPFVGRESERMAIAMALDARRLVLLDGSPGVGKTTLALHALAARGGVLLLRCRPEDSAVPCASALRGLAALREAAPDVVLPPRVRRDLALLVPEWADGRVIEADAHSAVRQRRAYNEAMATLAAGNFGALVIDDYQWADAASQALWDGPDGATLATALPTVVVHRSGELPPQALQRRRHWLDEGRAVAVRVPPLDHDELHRLLQALGADEEQALIERSAGNPLFLLETLRHRQRGGASALPARVQDVIVARARALGPGVRSVLEAASLAGDELLPRQLAAAAGVAELAVAQALDHAAAAELLVADGQGRHRFAHDLVSQALADSLSPARQQALHAQLAQGMMDSGVEPARVARHLDLAGRADEAAPWHLRAAEVAFQRQAWPETVQICSGVLAAAQDPALRLAARQLTARARRRQVDVPGAEAELRAALADAVRVGPGAVIDLGLALADLLITSGRAEAALVELQALQADPALSPRQRHQVLQEQANALSMMGRHAESLPRLRQLLADVPASDPRRRQRALNLLSRNSYWAGELDDARDQVQQLLDLSRGLGDAVAEASALFRLGVLDRERGRIDEAVACLQAAADLARREGHVETLRSALSTLATVRLDRLQLAAAEALIVEGEQASPWWESPSLEDVYDDRRYRLHHLRGEVDAAWAVLERSLQRHQHHDDLHSELGTCLQTVDLALATNDTAGARRRLDAAVALHARTGADSLQGRELAVLRVQVLLAEGDAAQALQQAQHELADAQTRRVHEHGLLLLAAAQAALDLGRRDLAGPWLAQAQAMPGPSQQLQARVLAVRLHHARCGGEPLAAAALAARDWLSQPVLPVLEARQLQAVLLDRRPGDSESASHPAPG